MKQLDCLFTQRFYEGKVEIWKRSLLRLSEPHKLEQGIEAPQLAGVYEQEGGKSKGQRENDGAFISSEETDHPCHLRGR